MLKKLTSKTRKNGNKCLPDTSNFVLFLCFSALFISAAAFATLEAGERVNYPVHFISIGPQIDGKLDEPVWQSLPEATRFYVLGGDVATAKQTFFRMCWDKDNLYIGIKCEEPDISEVIGVGSDGDRLWAEDSVEVFLSPAFPDYFQFVVNTIGSRIGMVGKSAAHTIEFWEAQSYKGADFWSTEIKIPFVSLGLDRAPQDGETWRGNICRNITVFTSGGDKHTTWAPLVIGFHEPDGFGSFIFRREELLPKEVKVKKITPPVVWKEVFPPIFSRYPGGTFAKGKLTSAAGSHIAPRLSPCGKKVLFNSVRGGKMGIWIVDINGERREERICDGEQASWSPDGERIIFRREGRIVERNLDTGKERVMSPSGWIECSFPSYSPDGEKIIFIKDKKRIFILEPGQEPRRLLEVFQGDIQCAPRFSPDGKRIAFQDKGAIYVIDIDGSNRRRLTTAGGIQASPLWSLCGRGIAYCQAVDADGPWDLYIIGVDDGRAPRLRMRKLDINPDWRVEYFGEKLPPQMGSYLHLWEIEKTSVDNESIEGRKGWKSISPDEIGKVINVRERSIAIENDWLIFFISQKEIFIFCKNEKEKIGFIPLDEKGRKLHRIRSLSLLKNGDEEVIIEVNYFTGSLGATTKIAYRIPRTRPFIEVMPRENAGSIYLRADMHFLVLPDRLASDLILDPSRYSASRIPLPSTNLSVGLLGTGNSLLLVSSKHKQMMELIRGKQMFTGIEASFEGESLHVTILTGERIWDLKKERIEDSMPKTPGLYRLSLYDKGKFYTRIFSLGEKISLPESWKKPELALSYLYGRTKLTPIKLLTIIDIMKEIEEKPLSEILEREGFLTYSIPQRKPDPGPAKASSGIASYPVRVPERLTTHRPVEDWIKYPHISFIIESLRDIYNHPHGKEYIDWLSGVIEEFIEGMNKRLVEYRNFTGQINSLLEMVKRESSKRGEFIREMQRIKEELNSLQERVLHLKPKKDITEYCEKIRAGKAGHLSFDILFDALIEHRELIREYKSLTMSLRDSAGMAITKELVIRELAEEIRKSTEVIGRKHFIEKKELLVIFRSWSGDLGRMSHVVILLLE